MDKNIFIKKYNPDVNSKFTDRQKFTQEYKKDSIEYKKELWKGITGDQFLKDVKKSEDFIIEFEKPNFEEIRSNYSDKYVQRENEKRETEDKMNKIREAAIQNVMKIQTDLGLNIKPIIEIKTHDELKKLQINDQDLLKEEKQKFNELLKNLEEII